MNRYAVMAGLSGVWLVAGCTVTNYTNARTLGKNQFEVVAEPALLFGWNEPSLSERVGSVAVTGRYGVADRIDVGLRAAPFTVGALAKFALTDPDAGKVDVAILPSVNRAFGAQGEPGLLQLNAPLLLGIDLREQDQLVVGAGVSILSADTSAYTATASLGYQIRLGPLFSLQPEIGALLPFSGSNEDFSPLIQAGVGIQVGSEDRR